MKINHGLILLALFLAALAFRLYFELQTPYLSPESYVNVRQIQNIKETGLPVLHDELSYSGRELFILPVFHYIVAALYLLLPAIALKLVPSLMAASLVPATYILSLELTKRKDAATLTAAISAFMPVFVSETLNSVSVYTLVAPLIVLLLYCFIKAEDKRFVLPFVLLTVALAFTHPSSLLLASALLLYLLFIRLEGLKMKKAEAELALFSAVLVFWLTFIALRAPLQMHGLGIVWQNTPQETIGSYFPDLSVPETIYKLGIVPFIAAVLVIYKYLFKEKLKALYLLMSFALIILLLLWAGVIQLHFGLMLLGIASLILFAQFYKLFAEYLGKTRFSGFATHITAVFIIATLLSSVLPSIGYAEQAIRKAPSQDRYEALLWLKDNTPQDAVILAPVSEGHLLTAVAERKNVADQNFLFIKDASTRFRDTSLFYTTPSKIEALRIISQYNVDYVLLTEEAVAGQGKDKLGFFSDKACFEPVYDSADTQVYMLLCEVKDG